jgi:hypothetical protein
MNKIVSHGLFTALGLSLGIFGTMIGLSANVDASSSSASSSSQTSEPPTYQSLAITESERFDDLDHIYFDNGSLQPYYDVYEVMDVATLRNGDGYFIVFAEDIVETINGTEVTFQRIHMRHLNLLGQVAWQHGLNPSDEFKLASSIHGSNRMEFHLETILVEANAVVLPINLRNIFTYDIDGLNQEVELGGNLSIMGVEAGDTYISAFIEIDLDTYAFTTFGKKHHAFEYIEFEEVHYIAQYRYLVSYDINRDFSLVIETLVGLDLNTLPVQGFVITEVIIALNENNDRVFSEDLFSGFFSDNYLDLDFSNFSLMNGTYEQGYNNMLILNLDYEFYVGEDDEGNDLTETRTAFVGEPLFSLDTQDDMDLLKDIPYNDDRVDYISFEVEVIVSLFDKDILLEVSSSIIHYLTGNNHDIGIMMTIDPETMEIYVIYQQSAYNFEGENGYQLISAESVIDRYTLINGVYVATTLLESTYRVNDLFKINDQFLIIADTNRFVPIDFDNGFVEAVLVLLYDESFLLLDGIALYGDRDVYEDYQTQFLSDNSIILYLYTESVEGYPADLYNDEQNFYTVTITLS